MNRENEPAFWTEVSLRVRPEGVEAVAAALQDATGNGVTIEPPIRAFGPDEGFEFDREAASGVRGYVLGNVGPLRRRSLSRQLRAASPSDAIVGSLRWRKIRTEDWSESWKEFFFVQKIGRVVVRPPWREYTPEPDDVVLDLEPRMAFGTGEHPTTRMCLLALQDVVRAGDHVFDYGCGSGVLAIAAVLLGAGDAFCNDTEPQAVESTADNAAMNGVGDRIAVTQGPIEVAVDGPYDLVLANINGGILIATAGEIAARMKPGARIVASGIIAERLDAVVEAFEAAGIVIDRRLEEGDWRSLVGRRSNQ